MRGGDGVEKHSGGGSSGRWGGDPEVLGVLFVRSMKRGVPLWAQVGRGSVDLAVYGGRGSSGVVVWFAAALCDARGIGHAIGGGGKERGGPDAGGGRPGGGLYEGAGGDPAGGA